MEVARALLENHVKGRVLAIVAHNMDGVVQQIHTAEVVVSLALGIVLKDSFVVRGKHRCSPIMH